jgi:hypothetical protein
VERYFGEREAGGFTIHKPLYQNTPRVPETLTLGQSALSSGSDRMDRVHCIGILSG